MRRLMIMALLIVGTMSPGRGTTAYFSSTQATASNVFTAASIELGGVPASSALVTFSNMYPGAAVYGAVTIQNSGTASLRYSVATASIDDGNTALGPLAEGLKLEIRSGTAVNCSESGFSSLTARRAEGNLGNADGSLLWVLGDATNSANVSNRELEPGATDAEALCFRVRLPETASTTLQGATTNVKFSFVAVQKSGL